MSEDTRPYRPCVGLMVINQKGQVFVGNRIDTPGNHWQMPQGGVEKGEPESVAALREMEEEIGTNNAEIIAESPEWYSYDLPKDISKKIWKGRYRGQTQKWFLIRFLGQDDEINIETEHPEFSAWAWVDKDNLIDMIVPFKRDVYDQVIRDFDRLIGPAS